ncbi:type II secretion system minor pseudopilin GspJ [Sphingomonas aracearum]|uniref:Type II secretion system protein J n=1 Tax=Sphingomonas aracearum TaxID=2283317 RepID=A0A369VZA3_9SPHN|nr:type II secretion system minor pseudopilin GspJ [Sphingomonas aracearum]RDE05151.1 type II secretion system protein GspJ [Sphingomonas aracearum]
MTAPTGRTGGFTLVEMMIALLIFGMLAAAGVALLSVSIRAQAATGAKLDDVAALNRFSSVFSADLAEAVARPTRNEAGDSVPAFFGAPGEMVLVRGGWTNLDSAPRASAQKVQYRVTQGALERITWPMLDGAPPLAPTVLLDHVASATLRYRYNGAWSDRWNGAATAPPLPQVVELSVQRENGTVFRQLALVGAGYDPRPPRDEAGGQANAGA